MHVWRVRLLSEIRHVVDGFAPLSFSRIFSAECRATCSSNYAQFWILGLIFEFSIILDLSRNSIQPRWLLNILWYELIIPLTCLLLKSTWRNHFPLESFGFNVPLSLFLDLMLFIWEWSYELPPISLVLFSNLPLWQEIEKILQSIPPTSVDRAILRSSKLIAANLTLLYPRKFYIVLVRLLLLTWLSLFRGIWDCFDVSTNEEVHSNLNRLAFKPVEVSSILTSRRRCAGWRCVGGLS